MTGKPRIHWFWRGAIAIVVANVYGAASVVLPGLENWHRTIANGMRYVATSQPAGAGLAVSVAYFLPSSLLAVATFGLLSRWRRPYPSDGETRCRRCGYILRGISEPRCPECGERI